MTDRDRPGQEMLRGRKAFSISSEARPAARRGLLDSDESTLNHVLLRMDVRVEFNGKSPLAPGRRQVTEAGAVANVAIFPFLFDLVAACSRLVRGESSQEAVQLVPTQYGLRLQRSDSLARISLVSEETGQVSEIAEAQETMHELALTCLTYSRTVLTWMASTNPVLKGNLEVRRFAETMDRLEEVLARQHQGRSQR